MKNHYELLGVAASADVDTIKKAFRREIALYHPDKVAHLGQEFQVMASQRAAELTIAYGTLSHAVSRHEYDTTLPTGDAGRAAHAPVVSTDATNTTVTKPVTQGAALPQTTAATRAAANPHRAGRDDIIRRAALGRVRQCVTALVDEYSFATVSGFDLACICRSRGSLFRRRVRPSVLVRVAETFDRTTALEAWRQAMSAAVTERPLVLLLIGERLPVAGELGPALEEQRRRHPHEGQAVYPVAVAINDWTARVPADIPAAVRELVGSLCRISGEL